MEIEKISIQRDGDYYRVRLAVDGFPVAYDPCIFEFWQLEEHFGAGSQRFYKALAVKCLGSHIQEAGYWIENGRPSMKADRDRAAILSGQLRAELLAVRERAVGSSLAQ